MLLASLLTLAGFAAAQIPANQCSGDYSTIRSVYDGRDNVPPECIDVYLVRIIAASYNDVMNQARQVFSITTPDVPTQQFTDTMVRVVDDQLNAYMVRYRDRDFTCTSDGQVIPCPLVNKITFSTTTWTPKDPNRISTTLADEFGIQRPWLTTSNLTVTFFPSIPITNCPFPGPCTITFTSYPTIDTTLIPTPTLLGAQLTSALEAHDTMLALLARIAFLTLSPDTPVPPLRSVVRSFAFPFLAAQQTLTSFRRLAGGDPSADAVLKLTAETKALLLSAPAVGYQDAKSLFQVAGNAVRVTDPRSRALVPFYDAVTRDGGWFEALLGLGQGNGDGDLGVYDKIAQVVEAAGNRQYWWQFDLFETEDQNYLSLLGRGW
ncbi:hypothetical protein KVT40_001975 [Elsinoe batatas]|uniref:Uncharacterized protein n=1 Tax=Elsinoe batatas TaxID=2601811 RepID=A0A8K0L5M4_9PEZI|nr:hypothetical protein KVT40_001975 [Elsinoe batatas]